MNRTVYALTDLCAVDDRLSGAEARVNGDDAPALEERRAALRNVIPPVILAVYDALGRLGRRPVIVETRRAHCGGCNLRLPPQLDATIRRRQSLCACPHCRRLLYMPPAPRENEIRDESRDEPGVRPAVHVRASKRVGPLPGRRPARQKALAAKRREPGGKNDRPGKARRASKSGDPGSAEAVSGKAKSVGR